MSTYVISDTHFGHLNILAYEPVRLQMVCDYAKSHNLAENSSVELFDAFNELYKDKDIPEVRAKLWKYVEWHTEMLVEEWNSVVRNDDMVYFLGDFTLSPSKEIIQRLTGRLRGSKVLIAGNHDVRKPKDYVELGWTYAIPFCKEEKRKSLEYQPGVHLMHIPPTKEEAEANPNRIYIFGHVHGKHCDADDELNCRCVCVERQFGRPLDLDRLIMNIKERLAHGKE